MPAKYTSEDCDLRNDSNHATHLTLIQGPTASHYSTTYGINRRSSLLDVKHFSLFTGGLPRDIMHDILEGIAPMQIKRLLCHYDASGVISLDEFNRRLVNFNYGYSECDHPVPILRNTLDAFDKPLRQSASQTLLLMHIFPFLVANKVTEDDEHWKCFLLMKDIIDIVLCPTVTESLSSSLKLTVKEYLLKFFQLYGIAAFIPKLHFLIHYPEQMLQVGPMVRTWTMRHEAKLNFLKQASHLANFKNITYSLANRHQRWMCYENAGKGILYAALECGPARHGNGLSLVKEEDIEILGILKETVPDLSLDATIFRPTWVKRDGIIYKVNNAYLIVDSDGLDPIFGQLDDFFVIGGDIVIFCVTLCKVLYYDSHYHSYVVANTSNRKVVSSLVDHTVYHAHTLSGFTYITLKSYFLK